MNELGKPRFFDVDAWLGVAVALIRSDEVERAFWLLNNPPAYFRVNYPLKAKEMRDRLHKQLFTPIQYARGLDDDSATFTAEMKMPSRGELVDQLVKELNEKGICPVICELAPGARWLEGIMTARGRKFWYEHMGLDKQWIKMAKPEAPLYNIFVAFEIIEHLADTTEIYRNYLKFERQADAIFMSTPYCTWGGGMEDWENNALGHLRAYTPDEFANEAKRMFDGYSWQMLSDDVMTLVARKL